MLNIKELKEKIQLTLPLSQLISQHIKVHKRGGQHTACCPFHGEKTPSFFIYPDHYHCFGCGDHGDIISFIQKIKGLGFQDSLQYLAEKAGVPLEGLQNSQKAVDHWKKQNKATQILLEALQFFQSSLKGESGEEARSYLSKRHISNEEAEEWEFGYAIDQASALTNFLTSKNHALKDLQLASLTNVYEQKTYDFFRHRLMLPIKDHHGKIIAFAGRALDANSPLKYKNSRFDKKKVLFGLHKARQNMRQKNRAIVVEGYMDVISLHRHGFNESVACQGTALSHFHLSQINSACSTLILLFDSDQAGAKANLKILEDSFNFPDLRIIVCTLPQGEDPDSFLNHNNANSLEAVLEQGENLIKYAIDQKLAATQTSMIPIVIKKEFLPWVKSLADPIQQSFFLNYIEKLTNIPMEKLQSSLVQKDVRAISNNEENLQIDTHSPGDVDESAEIDFQNYQVPPLSRLEFELLGNLYYLKNDDLSEDFTLRSIAEQIKALPLDPIWMNLFEEFLQSLHERQAPCSKPQYTWSACQNQFIFNILGKIIAMSPAFSSSSKPDSFRLLLNRIKSEEIKLSIKNQQSKLSLLQKNWEQNKEEWNKVAQYIMKLNSELKNVERQPIVF